MKFIDLHSDTITVLTRKETLKDNNRMVSLDKLKQADALIQCFSIFIPTGQVVRLVRTPVVTHIYNKIYKRYQCEVEGNKENLISIRNYRDILMCEKSDRIGVLLTIEDGGVLCGKMNNLYKAFDRGVRLITLTWNHENAIGYPNSVNENIMNKGLKQFGIEVIEEMNRLGIIVDVSHLSDGGFYDVVQYTKKPFIASHSNSRAITDNPRNLTDDMIRALANHGGVMGLNYAPKFLNNSDKSCVEDMVRHILHIRAVGGSTVLALGSDFDGIHGELEIAGPTDIHILYDALHAAGLSEDELELMWYKNAKRVFRDNF